MTQLFTENTFKAITLKIRKNLISCSFLKQNSKQDLSFSLDFYFVLSKKAVNEEHPKKGTYLFMPKTNHTFQEMSTCANLLKCSRIKKSITI